MHYPLIQFVFTRLLRAARAQHLRLRSAFLLGVFLCTTPVAFLSCGGAELLEGTAHAQRESIREKPFVSFPTEHSISLPVRVLPAPAGDELVRRLLGLRSGMPRGAPTVSLSYKKSLHWITLTSPPVTGSTASYLKWTMDSYDPPEDNSLSFAYYDAEEDPLYQKAAWQLLKYRLWNLQSQPEEFPDDHGAIRIYQRAIHEMLVSLAQRRGTLPLAAEMNLVCAVVMCDNKQASSATDPAAPPGVAGPGQPTSRTNIVWKPLLSAEDLPPLIEDVKKLMTAPGFPAPAVPEEKLATLANLWNQFEPDEKRLLASNLSPGLDAEELEQALLLHVGLKGRIARMYHKTDEDIAAETDAFERYLQEVFEGENLREVKTMTREQRCEKAEQLGDRISAAIMKWTATHPTTLLTGMFQFLNPMHHYRAQEQAKEAAEDPGALPSERRGYLIRRGKAWADLACSVAAWGAAPVAFFNPAAGASLLKGSMTASLAINLAAAPLEAYQFKQAACDRVDPYRFKNAVLELGSSKSAYQMTGATLAIILLLRRVAQIPRVRAYLVQFSRALKSLPASRWLSVRPRIVAAVRSRFRIDLDAALQRAQLQIQQTVAMLEQAPTGRALLRLAAAGNVLARGLIGLPQKKYAQALKQVEQFPRYAKGWDQVSATLRRRMGQLSERLGTWKKQFLGRLEEQVGVIEQAQDAGAGEAALAKMTADFSDAGTFEQTLRGEAEQLRQELAAKAEMLEGDRGPSIRTKAGEGLLAESAGMSLKRYRGWLVEKARQLWSKQGSERQAELNGLLDRAVAGSEAGEVVGLVGFLEEALRLPAGKAMARIERVLMEASRLGEGLKRGGGDSVVRVRGEKAEVVERGDWSLPESLKKQEQLLGMSGGTGGRALQRVLEEKLARAGVPDNAGLVRKAREYAAQGRIVGLEAWIEEVSKLPDGEAARQTGTLFEAFRLVGEHGEKPGVAVELKVGGHRVVEVRPPAAAAAAVARTGTDGGPPVDLRGQVVSGGGGPGRPGEIVASAGGGKPAGPTEVGTVRGAGGPASGPEGTARPAEPPVERPQPPVVPQPVEVPIPVRHPGKPIPTPEQVRNWIKDFPTKDGPSGMPQNQYEIRQTGPKNVEVRGGNERIWADGISSDGYLQEAKFVDNPKKSPYIACSDCYYRSREGAVRDLRNEFRRYRAVINDPTTPVIGLELITNLEEARPFFEDLFREYGIPGRVIIKP